jgi:hypothetical protein
VAFSKPPVLFPDVKAWAVGYLTGALAGRPEPVASGVAVRTVVPATMPARLVTVRDDGGPRSSDVTKVASLGVNVWAATAADASDLSALVAALFEAAPGDGPVVAHEGASGPFEVAEDTGKPHWYLSVDLRIRGTAL